MAHHGPISKEEIITNEFEMGFNNDLDAIFRSSASFVGTISITPFEFIYGLGEFKEDLKAFLDSTFVGVAFILPAKYGEVQDVKELEGDCADSIVGDECMFLGQDFCSDEIFEHSNEVIKSYLHLLHIKALIEGKLINKVLSMGHCNQFIVGKYVGKVWKGK